MDAMIPRSLPYRGRTINHAGAGRAPGSVMYYDAATGRTLELFFAQVAQAGPLFAYADVANNRAFPRVTIDQARLNGGGPARAGDVFIIGPIEHRLAGARAAEAWPARLLPAVRSRSPHRTAKPLARKTGVITAVPGPTWGFITPDDGGRDAFLHATQLSGLRLVVGRRLSYEVVNSHKGPMAVKARAL